MSDHSLSHAANPAVSLVAPATGEARAPAMSGLLLTLSLMAVLPALGTSIANVALPTLARVFNASFPEVQWVVLAYLLGITTLIVSVGRLGDIMGRRRLLSFGIVVFTFASLACGLSSALWLLIVARLAQGIAAAVMMSLALALVGDTVPRTRTGSVMGLLGTMSAIGTALGPSLGGLMISSFGWRAIFLFNVPLGLAALVFARRYLPADRRGVGADRRAFDYAGTSLLAVALAAYALAVTLGRGHFGAVNAGLLAVAVASVALFGWVEAKSSTPLVSLAVFRETRMRASLAMSAIVAAVLMSTLVVGPFYLSQALGLAPAMIGVVMSVGPIVAALGALPAGRLVDRVGGEPVMVVGLVAIGAGALALALLPSKFGLAGYVAPLVVLTGGYAFFQTANNTAVMAGASPGQRGVMSGLLNLSRNLGLITGASVMGAIFVYACGGVDVAAASPAAVVFGLQVTFLVATGLVVIALILAAEGASTPPELSHAEPLSGAEAGCRDQT